MIVPHRKRDVLVLAAACVAVAVGARSFAAGQATTTLTLAVTGGTLIDVRSGRRIPDAVVVIQSGRINAAGSRQSVQVPAGAKVIDARGRWLIPGLTDMHVHVGSRLDMPMGLFLANGVTTIRDTGGAFSIQRLMREAIDSGKRAGPRMFIAGAILDGNPPV